MKPKMMKLLDVAAPSSCCYFCSSSCCCPSSSSCSCPRKHVHATPSGQQTETWGLPKCVSYFWSHAFLFAAAASKPNKCPATRPEFNSSDCQSDCFSPGTVRFTSRPLQHFTMSMFSTMLEGEGVGGGRGGAALRL